MTDIQSSNSSQDVIKSIEACIKYQKIKFKQYLVFALLLLFLCLPNCVRSLKEIPSTMNLYKNNSSFAIADIVRLRDSIRIGDSKHIDISFNISNNKIFEQIKVSSDFFDFITKNNVKQITVIYIKSNPKKFEIVLPNEFGKKDILLKRIEKDEKKSAYIEICLLLFSCLAIILTPLVKIKKYKRDINIYSLGHRTITETARMMRAKSSFIYESVHIQYVFGHNGKKYIGFSHCPKSFSELDFIKKDSKLEIAFDPKNPRRNFAIDVYYYLSNKK